jgi:uncharacterized protein (TIGR02246 family)
MTTTRTIIFFTLILIFPAFAYAEAEAKDNGVREVSAAIDEANTKFSEAFERGDFKALSAMYTSDAIAFPPDSEMIQGNEAIGEFWNATWESGVKSVKLTALDVGRSGDIAYEAGKVSLTIHAEGKEPTIATAKYVVVWKRQADGSWKLHRDIWNSLPSTK